MTEIIRNPAMIAGEINTIKEQVRATALSASVEIGKRLTEAKALVPEGEWTRWLKDNVDYSLRTAQNLMALFQEYGGGTGQSLPHLSYTQAVMLLALPGDERAEFMENHDMDSLSTRDLKKELDALRGKQDEMQITMDQMIAEKQALEAERDKANAALTSARQVSKGAMDAEKALRDELKAAQEEAQKEKEALEQALKDAQQPVIQQVTPPDVEKELADLRAQVGRGKAEEEVRAAYEMFRACYERMIEKLSALEQADADRAGRFRAAFATALRRMTEELEKGAAG